MKQSQPALSKRALNRALLARQMLLERKNTTALATIEQLAGMQAQIPRPPFMGLWTRLQRFERGDLLRLVGEKQVVRATAMRGTIHLLSTKDFLAFRPILAPMLVKGANTVVGKRMSGVDLDHLYGRGREFFGNTPAPFDDFRKALEKELPRLDVRAMAYAVRMGIPLVMVPADVYWGYPGNAAFALAETWLGAKVPEKSAAAATEAMVLRYLAAFGPATPADFQAWSALGGMREVFEKLRPKLVTFRDERKRELFDVPNAPRPDADTPAPVRYLPEYDNVLLAHDDRTRIVSDEHRSKVITKNLQVVGSFLIDGFGAGIWQIERKKKAATLNLKPFAAVPKKVVPALEEEGESLLGFLEPEATSRAVQVGAKGFSFR